MHKYEMIVYWSEDDASFIVEVPELPGCMADGATAVDALINAEQAINEWIETANSIGREIPQPKGRIKEVEPDEWDKAMIKDIETNPDCKEFVSEAEALKELGLD